MAEVIGIFASAAALIQLVSYGKKSARALHRFSHRAGFSKPDVERCANHLRTFSLAVSLAVETLDEYDADTNTSPVFDFMKSEQVLRAISIDSDSLVMRLNLVVKRFRSLSRGSRTPVAFVKWWLHKDDVITLFPEMERIKTNLTLIIAAIQLKLVYTKIKTQSSDSLAIRKLKKKKYRLESSIRTHLDMLAKLEDQIECAHQRISSIGQGPSIAASGSAYEALFRLGKSIAKTGDVPNTASASPRPTIPQDVVQSPTTSKILDVDTKDISQAITGYIRDPENRREPLPAVAALYHRLDGNIISMLEARKLRLDVVPNDEDKEEVRISFDGLKPQKCVGKVEILWSKMIGGTVLSHLILQLYVVEHGKPDLIFGEPFTQAAEKQKQA